MWKLIFIELVRYSALFSCGESGVYKAFYTGRTGRFGRKGISINFVHNDKTWRQMQDIEAVMGKVITKVDTDDLDVMEEVRSTPFFLCSSARS